MIAGGRRSRLKTAPNLVWIVRKARFHLSISDVRQLEGSNPLLESLGLRGDHGWIMESVGEHGYALGCG
jgi:hypothetical protein